MDEHNDRVAANVAAHRQLELQQTNEEPVVDFHLDSMRKLATLNVKKIEEDFDTASMEEMNVTSSPNFVFGLLIDQSVANRPMDSET